MSQIVTLINAATAAATGPTFSSLQDGQLDVDARTFQATVVGTGAVTATVTVSVSNDNTNWLTLGVITLSGTTSATDGFASNAPWAYVRAATGTPTGTGATVTAKMAY